MGGAPTMLYTSIPPRPNLPEAHPSFFADLTIRFCARRKKEKHAMPFSRLLASWQVTQVTTAADETDERGDMQAIARQTNRGWQTKCRWNTPVFEISPYLLALPMTDLSLIRGRGDGVVWITPVNEIDGKLDNWTYDSRCHRFESFGDDQFWGQLSWSWS